MTAEERVDRWVKEGRPLVDEFKDAEAVATLAERERVKGLLRERAARFKADRLDFVGDFLHSFADQL